MAADFRFHFSNAGDAFCTAHSARAKAWLAERKITTPEPINFEFETGQDVVNQLQDAGYEVELTRDDRIEV